MLLHYPLKFSRCFSFDEMGVIRESFVGIFSLPWWNILNLDFFYLDFWVFVFCVSLGLIPSRFNAFSECLLNWYLYNEEYFVLSVILSLKKNLNVFQNFLSSVILLSLHSRSIFLFSFLYSLAEKIMFRVDARRTGFGEWYDPKSSNLRFFWFSLIKRFSNYRSKLLFSFSFRK